MAGSTGLNYSKLLGFGSVTQAEAGLDFRDESIDARLGAKVGVEGPPTQRRAGSVDFQGDAISAKLGAKISVERPA